MAHQAWLPESGPQADFTMMMKMTRAACAFLWLIWIAPNVALAAEAGGAWYAQFTPGFEHLQRGISYYDNGNYRRAHEQFSRAAFWADKTAQAQLGRMYSLGQGVNVDLARGWAWTQLAAERGYPQFSSIAATLWQALPPERRNTARAILEQELAPEYGDSVAVARTHLRMSAERRRATGSRLGANFLPRTIVWRPGSQADQVHFSGDTFYARDLWDFHRVVAFETRLFQAMASGRVEIKALELIEPETPDEPD
jgi:uncharacterized protein